MTIREKHNGEEVTRQNFMAFLDMVDRLKGFGEDDASKRHRARLRRMNLCPPPTAFVGVGNHQSHMQIMPVVLNNGDNCFS